VTARPRDELVDLPPEVRGHDIDVTFAPHWFTLLEVTLA
jgi:hypothetical protein